MQNNEHNYGGEDVGLQQVILNIILTSIPEEIFITLFILILLGRYDYLDKDRWKDNVPKILLISVFPIAIISNINLEIIKISANMNLLINIVLFTIAISILHLHKIKNIKQILKVLLITMVGLMLFMLSEIITIVIVTYGLHASIESFNQSAILNFILFIPERLIQYGFLLYVIIKKNSLKQVIVSKLIIRNKPLKIIVIFLTMLDIGILCFSLKYLILNSVISFLQIKYQLFIIIVILSLVIINILTIWLIAICIYPKEKYLQQEKKEE